MSDPAYTVFPFALIGTVVVLAGILTLVIQSAKRGRGSPPPPSALLSDREDRSDLANF